MITSAQLRQWQQSKVPAPAPRKPRGQGKASLRKAAIVKRLPEVLALLGVERLPDGIEVNPFPTKQNGDEERYGRELQNAWIISGKTDFFAFQPVRLRLAPGTFYIPDYIYRIIKENIVTVFEIKGQRHAAGIVKFKVARDKFPQFGFCMPRWDRKLGRWCRVRMSGNLKAGKVNKMEKA